MKQLKFMLAAATAVGIAVAAQAGATDGELFNENFNGYTTDMVGAAITNLTTGIPGFSFEGTEGDNESAIIKEAEGDMALKVNTGTDPLLRALDYGNTGAQDLDLADETAAINYVNIDTVVQFTVTPVGDSVDAKADDKLMIFLQEVAAAEEGGESTTKLVVKATKYQAAGVDEDEEEIPETNVPGNYDVKYADGSDVVVSANTPYLLTVKTVMFNGEPMFEVYIDGKQVVPAEKLNLNASSTAEANYFPALTAGKNNTTLTYVGFAGEGTVDDLVVTKNYNVPDSTDFTFVVTWDTGISAVAYTIGGVDKGSVPSDGFKVPEGETVELVVTLADPDWTKLAEGTVLKWTEVAADNKGIELTTVKITSKTDDKGNVTVNPDATTAEIQEAASITKGYFGGENTTASVEEFQAVLNWKSKKGGAKADINNIRFVAEGVGAGDPDTADAKAYLLDCDVDEVENEIKKFTFKGFSLDKDGKPVFGVGKAGVEAPTVGNGGEYGNGHVEIRGKQSLDDANWDKACANPNFFRAFLVK